MFFKESRYDTPGLPFAGSDDGPGIATGEFPAIEHRFKDAARFGGQLPEPSFLFRPE